MSGVAALGGMVIGTVGAAAGVPRAVEVENADRKPSMSAPADRAVSVPDPVVVGVASTTTTPPPIAPTAAAATETVAEPVTPEPAPAAEAAPAPTPAPTGSAGEAIAAWFPDAYDKAVRVAGCESNLNPGAVSAGGGNHGLFQINSVHRSSFTAVTGQPWASVYDAYYNAQFARHLYDSSGWQPWGCRNA